MNQALKIRISTRGKFFLPLLLGAVSLCLFSLLYPLVNKNISFPVAFIGLACSSICFLPITYSILFLYIYLFFDGAVKILSDYHPAFHVMQDVLLIAIFVRSVFDGENGGIRKYANTPFISLIFVFLVWIAIQYVNPFGIGILPSVAGTKVYFSGILLFAITYQHLKREDAETVFAWLTALGLAQATLAVVEYLFFQGFVFTLHPRYATIAGDRFVGDYFRPFGTTSAPGAPSMWIFLTAPVAAHLLIHGVRLFPRALALAHLLVSIPALLFCQVRAAMIITAVSVAIVILCPHQNFVKRFSLTLLISVALYVIAANTNIRMGEETHTASGAAIIAESQFQVLEKRALSLSEKGAVREARAGAFDSMLLLAEDASFGIGLSRVGAASAVWSDRIEKNAYFGKKWAFSDNLYRAMFTELGIFGMLAWLVLVLTIAVRHLKSSFRPELRESSALLWLCGTYPILLLLAGMGSEGILYNPTSSFFWLLLSMGITEANHVPAA